MEKVLNVPPILIKVAEKKEHLLKLQIEGEVYFGTFEGYRKQEENEFNRLLSSFINNEEVDVNATDYYRRDPLEGLAKRISGPGTIRFNIDNNKNVNVELPDIKFNFFQTDYKHLYCMYAIPSILDDNFKIDERMLKFGDHALIITQPLEFLKRLIKKTEPNFDMDYVTYYDKSSMKDGNYTVFQKPNQFDYQNEFRITTNLIDSPSVHIGDIRDISMLVKSEDLLKIKYHINYSESISKL